MSMNRRALKMKRLLRGCLPVLAALAAGRALATDMEHKMRTVKSFTTALGVKGEVVCDALGDWTFTVSCAVDAGRDAVTVRLASPVEALLKGRFMPHHPENGYTWVTGESAKERVVTAYSPSAVVPCGPADKPVFLVNATGGRGVVAEWTARPKAVRAFDVFGEEVLCARPPVGISRIGVPAGGHLEICW